MVSSAKLAKQELKDYLFSLCAFEIEKPGQISVCLILVKFLPASFLLCREEVKDLCRLLQKTIGDWDAGQHEAQ